VYPVRTPLILTMHTIVAVADLNFFDSPVHGHVVCINFLVVELLSNVYTQHHLRASPIFIPNVYQQHLCQHCPILGFDVIRPFVCLEYLYRTYSHTP